MSGSPEASTLSAFIKSLVDPWYGALANPGKAQENALRALAPLYAPTEYAKRFGIREDSSLDNFRRSLPIVTYSDLKPEIEKVRLGNHQALLCEPVETWVMTRGTTGNPKLIPTTRTHLAQILLVGARALVNFALARNRLAVLDGKVLNLNFPSEVGKLDTHEGAQSYGYSSGTYAKLNPELGTARLTPRQEEIDALGGGVSKKDWDNRFELVYNAARTADVKTLMGVTPVITAFGRYVKKRHDVYPRDIWHLEAFFCTSVAKIHSRYGPVLHHFYGNAPVVEMYTATEGVFGQQIDDRPYFCPNYDMYVFEAKTRHGVKMLHEMKPREWGKLIVSTPLFPRYDIGDLVEAQGKNYFRIIGRANRQTLLEHAMYNLISGRLP